MEISSGSFSIILISKLIYRMSSIEYVFPLTSAIVFGGLEPMDQFTELVQLIKEFRKYTEDDIVIYTGCTREEIDGKVNWLTDNFTNIIIKFGRFIPNRNKKYDDVLGVWLASDNQYAEKIC